MARESKIIIAKNIKIDKEYKEVLNYTEQQMLSLVETNAVASALDYSFIRDKGTISTNFTYSQALQCNYMAFQNKDYSNKWFFAWIEDVRYVNDGTTEISYTIDSWSTWFEKLTVGKSFVIREHVNDDTIGLHTLPEDVELGEYITYDKTSIYNNDCSIVIGTTFLPESASTGQDVRNSYSYGIYHGERLYAMKDYSATAKFINWCAGNGKAEAIQYVIIVPNWILRRSEWGDEEDLPDFIDINGMSGKTTIDTNIVHDATLDNNFVPKNKKLLTFPYRFFSISNNSGNNSVYRYEDIVPFGTVGYTEDKDIFALKTEGTVTPSCSIKSYVVYNNKQVPITNYDGGITGYKYPICSWATDVYTNWLTQNAINNEWNITKNLIGGVTSLMNKDLQGAGSNILSIVDTIKSIESHEILPDSVQGNVNSGDVAYTSNNNVMVYGHRGIKEEYAKIIDDYFTRFGYKVNRLKTPNITGRTYWNYIQIAGEDTLGYGEIPQKFMDEINRIARQGTTIWHNHANIGDYSLNNTIVIP